MATAFSTFPAMPDGVQTLWSEGQTRARAAMERGVKLVDEFGEFAKGNAEAVMASTRVAAKGVEAMSQSSADYGRRSFDSAAAALKEMIGARTPADLMRLQSDYARTSFDAAVAEGSRLSEAWLKLMGEVAQPISTRVAVTAEKIKATPDA